MDDFRKYLEQKDIVEKNIIRMINLLKSWLKWLPITVEESSYKELMNYIGYLQKAGKSIHHINRSLQTISHYYQFKKLSNIAISTRVKGAVSKAIINPLTIEELDKIYQSFESKSKNYYKESDRIILGLMIYQGLEMGDFMVLELKDIDLESGIIYVPSRGQRKSRKIRLESHQILPIHTYILQNREVESARLFSPQGEDYNQLHWQFKKLSKQVKLLSKVLGIKVEKLNHLRQSRISIWVKVEGIRKAQYLAGFRRVMSAERYRKADMKDLKDQILKYHPFK